MKSNSLSIQLNQSWLKCQAQDLDPVTVLHYRHREECGVQKSECPQETSRCLQWSSCRVGTTIVRAKFPSAGVGKEQHTSVRGEENGWMEIHICARTHTHICRYSYLLKSNFKQTREWNAMPRKCGVLPMATSNRRAVLPSFGDMTAFTETCCLPLSVYKKNHFSILCFYGSLSQVPF